MGKKVLVSLALVLSLLLPSTSVSAAPTSTDLLGNSIAAAARHDFLNQLAKSSKRSANLEFQVDPQFNSSLKREVLIETQVSAGFWSHVRPIDQKVKVYVSPTNNMKYIYDRMWPTLDANGRFGNWLQVKMAKAKADKGLFGGGAPAYDKNNNPVFMMFAPNNMSLGNGFWTSSTAHEFTHVIQRYIMHGNFAPIYGWMLEGQADYIGANLGTRNSDKAFASFWAQLIQSVKHNTKHPEMLHWNATQFEAWFKKQEITQAPSENYKGDVATEIYVFGAVALQYLYGAYGFDAVTSLYDNLAKIAMAKCPSADVGKYPQCTTARHEAFEKSFGISLDAFYKKVSAHIVQEIKWSKVTVGKLPKNLLKIAPAAWAKTAIQKPYVSPPGLGVIEPYSNPLPAIGVDGGSGTQLADTYPPNVPAPNRTCPTDGLQATLYGASMTCVKGVWVLDLGQKIVQRTP